MKTPTRSHSVGNSSQPSPRLFGGYASFETRATESTTPPRPLIPLQETAEDRGPALNGPTTMEIVEREEKLQEPQDDFSAEGVVMQPLPESKGVIPLQDLDDEPDMMKEESDTPSEAASEPDLEWQAEPTEVGVVKTSEAAVNMQEPEPVADEVVTKSDEEEEDEGFEHGAPLNYYGDNDVEEELVVPEGCVRIEYQPQPKPPSPVEVSDVETLSPPPPSPPPPPPEIDEDDEAPAEMRDEGVGQEFPSPPPELLPSPPPELTDEFKK